MSGSLYERLGGEKGISAIARDTIASHQKNPEISARFQDSDLDRLHRLVVEFFGSGSGGPQKYTGKDMREAHKSMNISGGEFLAVIDDIMSALTKNDIDTATQNEVLGILYSLKPDVVRL